MGKYSGGNLPPDRKYENLIKDVTIHKSKWHDGSDAYIIQFTGLEEQIERKQFLFFKPKISYLEHKHTVPFAFKSLEIAKDFAEYLPNMSLDGERMFIHLTSGRVLHYETYSVNIDCTSFPLYIKFVPDSEHTSLSKCQKLYYINDLDKTYLDGNQGNFYDENDLLVDYFFVKEVFTENKQDIKKSTFGGREHYNSIGDFINEENENTHHFILKEV